MATVGNTGAPSTDTLYYDALLSTTLKAYVGGGKLFDNIFKDSAFLTWLRRSNAVDYQDGGERIAVPLMYGNNNTVKAHHGYSIIDTTPQEGFTTAHYNWCEVAGSISISRLEERQNSGESKIINLLKSKIMQAEMTMSEVLNQQLIQGDVSSATFVPKTESSGALGLNPLGWFLRKNNNVDPLAGGNVGGIAGSTQSWWRGRTMVGDSATPDTGNEFAVAITTFAGLKAALYRMWNTCQRGSGGGPDLVLTNQVTFEEYELSLDSQKQYVKSDLAELGFENIKLKGATCLWDEQVPDIDNGTAAITSGTAFFINTKFYKLIIDKMTDIVVTPFVEPENQTAKTAKILFMGNSVVSNLRKHGVLYAISQTLTS